MPFTLPISNTYKINNTAIPDPTGCTVNIHPLHGQDSGRTADGKMHTTIIATKRDVELSYNYISQAQLSALLALVNVQYYNLTYPDPQMGAKTIECYGSDLSQTMHNGVIYGGLWRDIKITCVER